MKDKAANQPLQTTAVCFRDWHAASLRLLQQRTAAFKLLLPCQLSMPRTQQPLPSRTTACTTADAQQTAALQASSSSSSRTAKAQQLAARGQGSTPANAAAGCCRLLTAPWQGRCGWVLQRHIKVQACRLPQHTAMLHTRDKSPASWPNLDLLGKQLQPVQLAHPLSSLSVI